jgi:hypothetical protein
MRAEPRRLALVGRYAILAGVVLLAAVPVYVYLEPTWRALFARLIASLVLGMALLELRGILAGRVASQGTSALEAARIPPVTEPGVPHRLLELTASLRAGLRNRGHFERVLWPRLTALATRPLVPPPPRRGRGPSLASLRNLITTIEDER